jgi:uroporphyrinogen decarboxylase
MTTDSRSLVRQTLALESPRRVPRQTWLLPWAELHFPSAVQTLHERYPDDIVAAPELRTAPTKAEGDRHAKGEYVDDWGCRFSNPQDGIIGIVHTPLVAEWSDLDRFETPEAVLSLDVEAVNRFCRSTSQYVLSANAARPFERLQFIRTMEQALIDLMEQPPELFDLLERIHSHYLKEVEVWAKTEVDGIAFMDDWGTQTGLLLHPETFRRIFKPMYRDYAQIARDHGKHLFMHSDGYITDIIPDLIEVGVDALNSQIFCMGIEELGRRFKGRITFWGEIDRQHLLVHGSPREIERAVHLVRDHLYAEGGVIAQLEFGLEANPENVLAVFETWNRLF